MGRSCRIVLALSILAAAMVPFAARAQLCPSFPQVEWWEDMTHESANRIVRERYDGNWLPIIDTLLDEQEKIESAQAEGETYTVPRTARKLSGRELETYLNQVRLSVLILQCLARKDQASACPYFPNVLWWGDIDHATVTRHVQDHYDGNWFPIIDMLLDELEIME